jgi:hypothetical protein
MERPPLESAPFLSSSQATPAGSIELCLPVALTMCLSDSECSLVAKGRRNAGRASRMKNARQHDETPTRGAEE